SERSERNPWKASPTWIPPRRGEGLLPRVKRAQRAQPVESVADIETAPEGRRDVATGEASAASATRGQRRANEGRPGGAGEACDGQGALNAARLRRPSGAAHQFARLSTGCAAPPAPLYPWQQSGAPPGRRRSLASDERTRMNG